MAITVTLLTSGSSATDATSYDTASISPTTNRLIVAVVAARTAAANATVAPSGGGMTTWDEVATHLQGGDTRLLSVKRALQASPGSGVLTFDFGAVTQSWCLWSVFEVAGIDTGGTNGSAAIVQAVTGGIEPGTSLEVTLAAFGSGDNGTLGAFYCTDPGVPDTNFLVGSGFTKIHAFRETTDSDSGLLTEWRADNDTSVDASFNSSNAQGIAVEIKAAAGGGGGSPRFPARIQFRSA